jgi:hypothetical protein
MNIPALTNSEPSSLRRRIDIDMDTHLDLALAA